MTRQPFPQATRSRRAAHIAPPVLGAISLVALLGNTSPAAAYRTATDLPDFAGTSKVRWASDTVEYVLNEHMPSSMSLDEFGSTVRQALEAWTEPGCSTLRFRSAGATSAPAARGDGLNTIQWITEGWSERGLPQDAAALTDVQYAERSDRTWVVVEADLFLNAELYEWVP